MSTKEIMILERLRIYMPYYFLTTGGASRPCTASSYVQGLGHGLGLL